MNSAGIKLSLIGAIVLNEVRMRTRRLSSLVAVLVVVAISWMMVADPATGRSMISVNHVRALYNSTALALGSSMLASFLLGLGSFYLVRGRTREDLRHGMGAILATAPMSNATFLFARWLGGVAYLCVLILALMATMMVLQLVRGEAPVEPLVYLQMYALMLLPTVFFAAAVAVLCDACAPLMGKFGDVVYFVFWIAQFSAMPQAVDKKSASMGWIASIDISGLATLAHRLQEKFHHDNFNIGGAGFDRALVPFVMHDFWTWEMMATRVLCAMLAMVPLLPAILLFHRFSPDRVKASGSSTGRIAALFAWLNRLLRPATMVVRPLLGLAARLPGAAGQVMADIALALISSPISVVALPVLLLAGTFADLETVNGKGGLSGVLVAAIACWGILISDLSVRDYQSATESLAGVVPGGLAWRYARHLLVAILLGLMLSAAVVLRWLIANPFAALTLLTGVFALAAMASLLGRSTRTGRTFLALFLFGLYVSMQVKDIAWFDVVGFNGAANSASVGAQLLAGVIACVLGGLIVQRRGNS